MLVSSSSRPNRRRERLGIRAFLVGLALVAIPTAALACKGGIAGKSPENPSAVLAIVGTAGIFGKQLLSRMKR
jgi:hypothetical protein